MDNSEKILEALNKILRVQALALIEGASITTASRVLIEAGYTIDEIADLLNFHDMEILRKVAKKNA